MSDRFWDLTVAHFANADGSWPVQVYGAHEASHPTRVREAIATTLEKAPECADTIVALIWRNMILENRLANLKILDAMPEPTLPDPPTPAKLNTPLQ